MGQGGELEGFRFDSVRLNSGLGKCDGDDAKKSGEDEAKVETTLGCPGSPGCWLPSQVLR